MQPAPEEPRAATPTPVNPPRRSVLLYVFGVALVAAAVGGAAYYLRAGASGLSAARAAMETEAARGPRVVVATVAQGPDSRTITLLGDARPYVTATVFAKVSGYLKSVSVDKGDLVTTGQVIAEIDSSELESQYQGAVADLGYKQRLAYRAHELLRSGNVAQQAAEQADSSLRMAQETVRNLDTMRSYQVLRAPFDGTVVARFADPGALMQAATTNQASSLPVIQIADNSKLRIGAYVEQRDVPAIHVGDEADIVDASNPERTRKAKISRTAGTLDPRTRTLFIEMDLDNHDGFLVPGSFTYAKLRVPVSSFPQIPVAALVQRGSASLVASVGNDATVHFRPVKVSSTDGIVINLSEGVKPGDQVALNVPNEVTDGAKVRPVPAGR
jgi:RND family efflux transporter MFP subunit